LTLVVKLNIEFLQEQKSGENDKVLYENYRYKNFLIRKAYCENIANALFLCFLDNGILFPAIIKYCPFTASTFLILTA